MKRFAAPLLALVAVTAASACGGEREQAPAPQPPPAPTETMTATETPTTDTATTTTTTTVEKPPLSQLQREAIRAMIEAFNAHDARKIAALYTPDARVASPAPSGWVEESGNAAVEANLLKLFAAFPDLRWASPRVYTKEDVVIQEWLATGTHKGDLDGFKATNKPIGLYGASVYWFSEDGRIQRDHTYYDASGIGIQTGAQKGQTRAIPDLPVGEPQFLVSTGSAEDMKWVDAAKALYAAFQPASENAFLGTLARDVVQIVYSQPADRRGEKAAKEDFRAMVKAFPDIQIKPKNVWGFGERVVAEVEMSGTHKGPLGTTRATKKPVTLHKLEILRFGNDGKVVEMVSYGNTLELMGQLGLLGDKTGTKAGSKPAPAGTAPGTGAPKP